MSGLLNVWFSALTCLQLTHPRWALIRCRHHELGAFANAFWPTLHDRLLPGVETNPLFTIRMHIAKERTLPATKTMPGHRDRNRHIDAHHSHLYSSCKLAGHIAIVGETRHSTMSIPRVTSPNASVNTFPCSAVIMWAKVFRCWFNSARNLNITLARRRGDVSDAGCAMDRPRY